MLRDGRSRDNAGAADGRDVEIGRRTLLTAQARVPADPLRRPQRDAAPETGSPPPAFARNGAAIPECVGAADRGRWKSRPAAAWMRLDVPMVEGEANTPLLQAVQAADFSSGVSQIVDMREWTFINPEISLYFRPPEGEWILIRSRTPPAPTAPG
jgi:hypothetical protein